MTEKDYELMFRYWYQLTFQKSTRRQFVRRKSPYMFNIKVGHFSHKGKLRPFSL